MPHKRTVLIVCSHNAARSQMAEGWLRHLAGDRFEALSAGIEPGRVHPLAERAMNEVGIDLSGHRAEGIERYLGRCSVSYLIVVCERASKTCPGAWPGVLQRLVWPFEDPAAVEGTEAEKIEAFRRVRDQIRERIEAWLAQLDAESNRTSAPGAVTNGSSASEEARPQRNPYEAW